MKIAAYLSFIGLLFMTACNEPQKDNENLVIATAANMQFAMEELTDAFTQKTAIQTEMVISSSGKLTAQIKEGAPYDVFVAANMKYPNEIFENGLADSEPGIYANGRLVLWTLLEDLEPGLEVLSDDRIKHIALANPKTAPYGAAATQVLEYNGLYSGLEEKLVFGESIAQTNQYITSKSAEIGFTAMSVVLSPAMKGKGVWKEMDPGAYSPIAQGVVVIKHGNKTNQNGQEFYKFLFSNEAREILTNFGYSVNE